jgi:hypothetical protein
MTQLTKKERNELDALSKEVFGATSRWQKLIEKGNQELVTEEVTEIVPAEKEEEEPTKRKVQAPVLKNGSKQYVTKHYTVESVREYMLQAKIQLHAIREMIQKQQHEQKAKQDEIKAKEEATNRTKQIHQALSGSAR